MEEEEKEECYEKVQHVVDEIPRGDVLCAIGDWNAKVGQDETNGIAGRFGLGERSGYLTKRRKSQTKGEKCETKERCQRIQKTECSFPEESETCKLVTGHTTVTIGVVYRCPNITKQNNEKIQ